MSSIANPSMCALDAFRLHIAVRLSKILSIADNVAFTAIDLGKKGADFTLVIPRLRLKGPPKDWTAKIVNDYAPDHYVDRVEDATPFVQVYLNTVIFTRTILDQIYTLSQPSEAHPQGLYGSGTSGEGKRVVIESSSPNIAKPFHAGHLRSTIIGAFLANLFRANGWDVVSMNYLGDWGKQFGLLAVGYERYGSEEKLRENAIMHLFDVYVAVNRDAKQEKDSGSPQITNDKAHNFFKRMETGDQSALALWRRFRDLSIVKYTDVYSRLNVKFDVYAGESLVSQENMQSAMDVLKNKGLLTTKTMDESEPDWVKKKKKKAAAAAVADAAPSNEEEHDEKPTKNAGAPALAVDLNEWNLGKPVVEKPDGTTIYMMRDIAAAIQRYETYNFDKMIYVIGDQQNLHAAQFFKILGLMGHQFAEKLEHVNFGPVTGMSTRNGNVKFLDEILDMSKEAMFNQMKSNEHKFAQVEDPEYTSDQIGMTCVKVQDMQAKRINSYEFDPQRMTSIEGDTGAYLQYAHVRLCSIERKVASNIVLPSDLITIDVSLLSEPKAREIVFLLATYPDVVRATLKTYEPSTIVSFCFNLSHLIASAWKTLIVLGQDQALAQARLYMFVCAKYVLGNAMRLLSLTPMERM